MVESNDNEERMLRIEQTLERLVKATAALEAVNNQKVVIEMSPLAPRSPRTPDKWDRS